MTIPPGAFMDAGNWEDVFHPLRPGSTQPIKAWKQRANALSAMRDACNEYELRIGALEKEVAAMKAKPFPG